MEHFLAKCFDEHFLAIHFDFQYFDSLEQGKN